MQVVAIFFQLHRLHGKDLGHGDVRLENLIFAKMTRLLHILLILTLLIRMYPPHYINRDIEEQH